MQYLEREKVEITFQRKNPLKKKMNFTLRIVLRAIIYGVIISN